MPERRTVERARRKARAGKAPMAADFAPMAMAIGPIVNGAWGVGTGIGLALSVVRVRSDMLG